MWSISESLMPASLKQYVIACEGNPAQCFIRRNLSSSAAAISLPSRTSAAEESAWKAFRPRIIIALLILLLTSFSAPRLRLLARDRDFWRWPRSSGAAASARRLDQHREPVSGQQAPYGPARVEAFCECEKRAPVTLPCGSF